MAPVAGRHYAAHRRRQRHRRSSPTPAARPTTSAWCATARIPWTRETWIGRRYRGHMTGFPSVDVKSIGAGGGCIAWVDDGGLLHVGPAERRRRARARPATARGGTRADGHRRLRSCSATSTRTSSSAARCARRRGAPHDAIARATSPTPLGLGVEEAAAAILRSRPRTWSSAIEEITVNQGIDPRERGAGRRRRRGRPELGRDRARGSAAARVVIPEAGAALSAAGALMSDLQRDFARTHVTHAPTDFDFDGVERGARAARAAALQAFVAGAGRRRASTRRVLGRGALPASDLGDRGAAAGAIASSDRSDVAALARRLPRRARADVRDPRPGLATVEIVGLARDRALPRVRERRAAVAAAAGRDAR